MEASIIDSWYPDETVIIEIAQPQRHCTDVLKNSFKEARCSRVTLHAQVISP